MGAIGRYLDGLSEAARDRVLTAQDWTEDDGEFVDDGGCRCLVGHAEDWRRTELGSGSPGEWTQHTYRVGFFRCFGIVKREVVYNLYPALRRRVGTAKAVRLVKARAARPNRLPLAAPSPVTEQVAGD